MTTRVKWMATLGSDPTVRRIPEWIRSAALADDGRVYMPAAACGNETQALLAAGFDGVDMLMDDNHLYLPTDWMAREYPNLADLCAKIERTVKKHFDRNP